MVVEHIFSNSHFMNMLKDARNRLVIVDFFAEWCNPCHRIAPFFEQLSKIYSDAVFVKVDVDVLPEIARSQRVTAMPTFVFFRNEQKVDSISGVNGPRLESKIKHWLGRKQNKIDLVDDKIYQNDIVATEKEFFRKIMSLEERMITYEDPILQAMAISVIPVEKLEKKAREIVEESSSPSEFQDGLLLCLLHWFRTFFSWVDSPVCHSCGAESTASLHEHLEPTAKELEYGGSKVEAYRCNSCQAVVRFPRYNDPRKLIETRSGRCGEWANCFTLFVRAMGFEVRFVYDQTDHVWIETWSPFKDRWLHLDPCETVYDRPLLYELGWGKQLSYVIALSIDQVIDVSWRYSADHSSLLARRLLCRELRLFEFMKQLNDQKRLTMTDKRRKELDRRTISELVELLSPKMYIREDQEQIRSSGCLEWRKSRGEAGVFNPNLSISIEPNTKEMDRKELRLLYRCGIDEYERMRITERKTGWHNFVYEHSNIVRKEEFDWKIAYLARRDSQKDGKIVWTFDLSKASPILSISLFFCTKTFENGSVSVHCCAGDACFPMLNDDKLDIDERDLKNCNQFKIIATLTGGRGENAWQHAQLFRTGLNSNDPTFDLIIRFE